MDIKRSLPNPITQCFHIPHILSFSVFFAFFAVKSLLIFPELPVNVPYPSYTWISNAVCRTRSLNAFISLIFFLSLCSLRSLRLNHFPFSQSFPSMCLTRHTHGYQTQFAEPDHSMLSYPSYSFFLCVLCVLCG